MDSRALEAQALYWHVSGGARLSREERGAAFVKMAHLHEEIAEERLSQNDSLGWSDVYAGVTAWREADRFQEARSLVQMVLHRAEDFPEIRQQVIHELEELGRWLDQREADHSNRSGLSLPTTGAR
jgi:predicted alpha-1,6-mannanase (GH76 family)